MRKNCGTVTVGCWMMMALAGTAWAAGLDTGPITPGSQLTLKEAIAISLKFHPRRRQAAAQSGAAGERVGEARAELLPQVYSTSQYLRSTANGIGNTQYYNAEGLLPRQSGINHNQPANDFSQSADTENNYLGGVAASQFLLDFGRHLGYVEQRKFEAAAAQAQAR